MIKVNGANAQTVSCCSTMKKLIHSILAMLIFASLGLAGGCAKQKCLPPPSVGMIQRAYVGTYTGAKSQGIYTFKFDAATGKVGPVQLAAQVTNPSFLSVHPNRQYLYCVGDRTNAAGKKAVVVSAFAIETNGYLRLLNQQDTVGVGPCHLAVDKSGRMLMAANYGGGSVVAFPIRADGTLGEHSAFVQHAGRSITPRQSQPNAHSVTFSPDNRFAFVADLGMDQVLTYRLDPATATFTPGVRPFVEIAPGSGPRHFCFHPNGRFAYVINELAMTVTAFRYDAQAGALTELQTLVAPEERERTRTRLAQALRAITAQTLLPCAHRPGRVPMVEIMINNNAVRTAIQDAAFQDVPAIMERCRGLGMQTADLALRDLLSHHLITPEEAQQHATSNLPLTTGVGRKPRG